MKDVLPKAEGEIRLQVGPLPPQVPSRSASGKYVLFVPCQPVSSLVPQSKHESQLRSASQSLLGSSLSERNLDFLLPWVFSLFHHQSTRGDPGVRVPPVCNVELEVLSDLFILHGPAQLIQIISSHQMCLIRDVQHVLGLVRVEAMIWYVREVVDLSDGVDSHQGLRRCHFHGFHISAVDESCEDGDLIRPARPPGLVHAQCPSSQHPVYQPHCSLQPTLSLGGYFVGP